MLKPPLKPAPPPLISIAEITRLQAHMLNAANLADQAGREITEILHDHPAWEAMAAAGKLTQMVDAADHLQSGAALALSIAATMAGAIARAPTAMAGEKEEV